MPCWSRVGLETAWRRWHARQQFLQLRAEQLRRHTAAVRIQAAFRGFAVRHLLQRNQAATAIQAAVRGWLARQRFARARAAAATIQRAVRTHQARRRAAKVSAVKRQMAEMAALMREYQRRTAAALRVQVRPGAGPRLGAGRGCPRWPVGRLLHQTCFPGSLAAQAAYRGHVGRKQYRRLVAQREEARRLQAAREAAALAAITPWAATFRDRAWFLRARRAAPVLQRWWRREFARRSAAATAIQAAARCHLAQRHLQRSREAALTIQVRLNGCMGMSCRLEYFSRAQAADQRAGKPLSADGMARLPRARDAPAAQAAG